MAAADECYTRFREFVTPASPGRSDEPPRRRGSRGGRTPPPEVRGRQAPLAGVPPACSVEGEDGEQVRRARAVALHQPRVLVEPPTGAMPSGQRGVQQRGGLRIVEQPGGHAPEPLDGLGVGLEPGRSQAARRIRGQQPRVRRRLQQTYPDLPPCSVAATPKNSRDRRLRKSPGRPDRRPPTRAGRPRRPGRPRRALPRPAPRRRRSRAAGDARITPRRGASRTTRQNMQGLYGERGLTPPEPRAEASGRPASPAVEAARPTVPDSPA